MNRRARILVCALLLTVAPSCVASRDGAGSAPSGTATLGPAPVAASSSITSVATPSTPAPSTSGSTVAPDTASESATAPPKPARAPLALVAPSQPCGLAPQIAGPPSARAQPGPAELPGSIGVTGTPTVGSWIGDNWFNDYQAIRQFEPVDARLKQALVPEQRCRIVNASASPTALVVEFCTSTPADSDPTAHCSLSRFNTDGRLIRAYELPAGVSTGTGIWIVHDVIYLVTTDPTGNPATPGQILRVDEGAGLATPLNVPACGTESGAPIGDTGFIVQVCSTTDANGSRVLNLDSGALVNTAGTQRFYSDGAGGLWANGSTWVEHRPAPNLDVTSRLDLTSPTFAAALSMTHPIPAGTSVITSSGELWASFCDAAPPPHDNTCPDTTVTTARINATTGVVIEKWTVEGEFRSYTRGPAMIPREFSYQSGDATGVWYSTSHGLFRYNTH